MATEKNGYIHAGVTVLVLAAVYFILKTRNANTNTTVLPAPLPDAPDFAAPYYQTNPGIYDNSVNGGSPTFNSTNTVNINNDSINGLSNAYIPLFGLVGVTAVSG